MDIRKRLLRRPLTTVLWTILVALMALLAGAGGALVYASARLPAVLDDYHTTIAVQKQRVEKVDDTTWRYWPSSLFPSDIETLESLEMVEMVDLRTLTAAYIPELTSRIGLRPWGDIAVMNVDEYYEWNANDAYLRVVIAGTVEKTWMGTYDDSYDYNLSALGGPEFAESAYMCALVNIEELVVGHPDNYYFEDESYSAYSGKVIVHMPVYWAGEENYFQEGERYILQGQYDQFATLRDSDGSVPGLESSPHLFTVYLSHPAATHGMIAGDEVVSYDSYECTSDVSRFDVSMSNRGIEAITSVSEGFTPIAAKLDGTLEEFLADPDNAHWAEVVEDAEMRLHSFPVLGTEAVESMYVFLKNEASLVDGRFFTQAEYDAGERVCIISESVANAAGIQAGDTLSFSQFLCGKNYGDGNYSVEMEFEGILSNPSIGYLYLDHDFVTEDETFTVVGVYRLENEWENSEYAITPNTIFIPQKAQIEGGFGGVSYTEEVMETYRIEDLDSGEWEEKTELVNREVNNGVVGVYLSVILKNGQMEEFMEALKETTLNERLFLTFDQGYEAAQQSIQSLIGSAQKLFQIAVLGWLLLALLYVLLYQSMQRRNLGIMRSVGAGRAAARRYLFFSGLVPAAAGITIGTALSGTVASRVQEKLVDVTLTQAYASPHSGGMVLDNTMLGTMLSQSGIDAVGLVILAVGQFLLLALMLWLHAAFLARNKPRKLLGV